MNSTVLSKETRKFDGYYFPGCHSSAYLLVIFQELSRIGKYRAPSKFRELSYKFHIVNEQRRFESNADFWQSGYFRNGLPLKRRVEFYELEKEMLINVTLPFMRDRAGKVFVPLARRQSCVCERGPLISSIRGKDQ